MYQKYVLSTFFSIIWNVGLYALYVQARETIGHSKLRNLERIVTVLSITRNNLQTK